MGGGMIGAAPAVGGIFGGGAQMPLGGGGGGGGGGMDLFGGLGGSLGGTGQNPGIMFQGGPHVLPKQVSTIVLYTCTFVCLLAPFTSPFLVSMFLQSMTRAPTAI